MLRLFLLSFLAITSAACPTAAEDVYQAPTEFIRQSLGKMPAEKTLIIDDSLSEKVRRVMGDHYRIQQVGYWEKDGRTAWILEEIGKFKPITTGFVVSPEGHLERVKVLIYRESHGWEVKHDFFTGQFEGAGLKRGKKLDQYIDGISGATLSVDALKRLGALALVLHNAVRDQR